MARFCGWMGLAWLVTGCSGPTVPRPDPEICNDEIDNDGDGLVDCDDDNCGGLPCQNQGITDTSDTEPPALVEILLNDNCCDFSYAQSDCPQKLIGSVSIVNRDPELDGTFDISCDLVGPSIAAIEWKVVGGANQQSFLVNVPLYANSTVTIEGFLVCQTGLNQAFDTECHVKGEVNGEKVVLDHPVHASHE